MSDRALFATKIGVIATSVGSAVGLGNIWRFPYEVGVHGGGAFLMVYIICILLIGIPAVTAELLIGKKAHKNSYGAMKELGKGSAWKWVSIIGIIASLMILSFYSVIAGWTMEYLIQSVTGGLFKSSAAEYTQAFDTFTNDSFRPVTMVLIFLTINHLIIMAGVQKGIEKISNILMPILFIILLVFCINSLFLSGAAEGITFLFSPDFSQITPSVVLGAMGQAFFSLSVGLGCLLTYASYFPDNTPIVRTSASIAGLDTMVAILAGLVIFPIIFTFQGGDFIAGPRLVFEVLPNIFTDITGGRYLSVLFFLLLFFASITSTISMSEISISYFIEEFKVSRAKAAAFSTSIAVVFGVLCALSFGPLADVKLFDLTFFDFFNRVSSEIMLPIGGFFYVLFVGWVLDRKMVRQQLLVTDKKSSHLFVSFLLFCIRYVTPLAILLIFLYSLGVIS
ncbi:MAG: sodium-dependent transporter [Bacteroidales bacterium]